MVLIEALAMQIPTISTRITAIPELIIDGKTGLLIEPEDVTELAQNIEQLITKPELSSQLAANGRKHVEHEFDIMKSAQDLDKLFYKILQR